MKIRRLKTAAHADPRVLMERHGLPSPMSLLLPLKSLDAPTEALVDAPTEALVDAPTEALIDALIDAPVKALIDAPKLPKLPKPSQNPIQPPQSRQHSYYIDFKISSFEYAMMAASLINAISEKRGSACRAAFSHLFMQTLLETNTGILSLFGHSTRCKFFVLNPITSTDKKIFHCDIQCSYYENGLPNSLDMERYHRVLSKISLYRRTVTLAPPDNLRVYHHDMF